MWEKNACLAVTAVRLFAEECKANAGDESDERADDAVEQATEFLGRPDEVIVSELLEAAISRLDSQTPTPFEVQEKIEEFLLDQDMHLATLPGPIRKRLSHLVKTASQQAAAALADRIEKTLDDSDKLVCNMVDWGVQRYHTFGYSGVPGQTDEFWRRVGIRRLHDLSPEYLRAIAAVEEEADKKIAERVEGELARRLEEEAKRLDDMAQECATWFAANKIQRATLKDVEMFLSRHRIDIHEQTLRLLRARVAALM